MSKTLHALSTKQSFKLTTLGIFKRLAQPKKKILSLITHPYDVLKSFVHFRN